MKRLNTTAIAIVTAGALGLGTVPLAQAQDADLGQLGITPDKTGEGAVYVEQPDNRAPLPSGLVEQPGPTAVVGEKTTEGAQWVPENAPADPARATDLKELSGTQEPAFSNSINRPKSTTTVTETLKPPASSQQVSAGQPSTPGSATPGSKTPDSAAPTTTPATTTAAAGADKDRTRKIVLGTLGAVAGLGLLIGGVQYFVNKDGDLVKDQNRVNQTATPAEKAESDRLKKEHGDEIAKQVEAKGGMPAISKASAANGNGNGNATGTDTGTSAQGERGMSASTGVTQLPMGLVALLILSVLGAAGYAYTRRQTV